MLSNNLFNFWPSSKTHFFLARKAQFEAEKEREIIDRKAEMEAAKRRAELIEEERQKLLAKHAHNLLGYIPKGVLK